MSLTNVTPSGPRVTRADVERAAAGRATPDVAARTTTGTDDRRSETRERMSKRNVSQRCLDPKDVEAAGGQTVRQLVLIKQGIEMETAKMRAVLPQMVTRHDAIFNLQRGALLQAALAEGRFELLNEALRDRLHQPYRAPVAPGLSEVLHLNDEAGRYPGLLGVAISGAGSTLIAFATENCRQIGEEMKARMAACGRMSVTG